MSDKLSDAIAIAEKMARGGFAADHLRTLIAAARAQVPREPTQEMLAAADPINNFEAMNRNVWRAMYDAAPKVMTATPLESSLRHEAGRDVLDVISAQDAGGSAVTPHAADDALVREIDALHAGPSRPADYAALAAVMLRRARDRIAAQDAELARLARYARHKDGCHKYVTNEGDYGPCSCGLSAALAEGKAK